MTAPKEVSPALKRWAKFGRPSGAGFHPRVDLLRFLWKLR